MADQAGITGMQVRIEELRGEGQTVMLLEIDGRFAGVIGVADRIKDTTLEAIRLLHEDGLRIIMLTGDSQRTADAVAKKLGIDEVIAGVLPGQKSEATMSNIRQNLFLAFVYNLASVPVAAGLLLHGHAYRPHLG
jgi:Cu+-exporting ATPase